MGEMSKPTLLALTFLLGGFGAHKFYLGKHWQGTLYLVFFWTLIPSLIALVEFIVYAFTSEDKLRQRYAERPLGATRRSLIVLAVGMLLVLAVIGGVFVPAYLDKEYRSQVVLAVANAQPWQEALEAHFAERRQFPRSVLELRPQLLPPASPNRASMITVEPGGALTVTLTSDAARVLSGRTVVLRANADPATGKLSWDCTGGTLEPKYRVGTCRP
jgi:TM2 domain-containing membrane protein YozV